LGELVVSLGFAAAILDAGVKLEDALEGNAEVAGVEVAHAGVDFVGLDGFLAGEQVHDMGEGDALGEDVFNVCALLVAEGLFDFIEVSLGGVVLGEDADEALAEGAAEIGAEDVGGFGILGLGTRDKVLEFILRQQSGAVRCQPWRVCSFV
jgi:hypothetical protein